MPSWGMNAQQSRDRSADVCLSAAYAAPQAAHDYRLPQTADYIQQTSNSLEISWTPSTLRSDS
jgi:hypothetical protein